MITINGEKELVRIESWDDILERPDYMKDVDPKSIELETIIGSYMFSEPVPCGLSTCHQPHNKGYLVSTKNNKGVTNIGNVCGKNHFSVDFQTLRNKFNKDVRIKAQKEALQAFTSRIPGYEEQITELRDAKYGADWVHKFIKALKTPNLGVPEKIRRELDRMVRTGSNQVTAQREATEKEVDAQEGILGKKLERPYYIEEQIGILDGILALREDYNLRKILVEDVQPGIDRIAGMDIETASEHQLGMESKWAGELDSKLERAESAVANGRRLLRKQNLLQLMKLLDDSQDKARFKELLKDLPD